jgi:hypothetical protein
MATHDFHMPYMVQSLNPRDYKQHWNKEGPAEETLQVAHDRWRDLLDAPTEHYPVLFRVVNVDEKDVCCLGMKSVDTDEWGERRTTIHVLIRPDTS